MSVQKKKIKLKFSSFDHKILDVEVQRVVNTVQRTGAQVFGPIPLPVHIERFSVNRSPHVNKESAEQFERITHKRNLIIEPTEATIESLMKLELAAGVEVKINVLEGGM
jgi:small subunit ribosomal protein S10